MSLEASRNRVLVLFPRSVIQALSPNAKRVAVAAGTVLAQPGILPEYVYFLDSGLAVAVEVMGDGRALTVATGGREAALGARSALEFGPPLQYEVLMLVSGHGWRLPAKIIREVVDRNANVKALFLRILWRGFAALSKTAACNGLHTLRQRCCRFLLTVRDNVDEDTFALTHESLALALGATRPSVSLTLERLQKRKIISYARGSMTIFNRPELEELACECYLQLRHEYERYLGP